MLAQRLDLPGDLPRLAEIEVEPPASDEALIRVEACGMGLTVRDKLRRIDPALLPRVPGHELVGEVVSVGAPSGAPGATALQVGDRVAAYYYLWCGECGSCERGRPNLCERGPMRIGEHRDGGFAEFVSLPQRNLIPVPHGLDAVSATVACDALSTPVHVCRRAGVTEGTRLVIIGAAGGVGIHLAQLALHLGAEVVAIDVGGDRLRALAELAVTPVDAATTNWGRSLTSTADVVVDLVGWQETFEAGYRALAPGGQFVRMVTYRELSIAGLPVPFGGGERSVTGSRYCTPEELAEALRLLASGTIRAIVDDVVPLPELPALIARMDEGRVVGRAAVVPSR